MPKKKLGPYQKARKLSDEHFEKTGVRIPANTIYTRMRAGRAANELLLPVGRLRHARYTVDKRKARAKKKALEPFKKEAAAKKAAKQLEPPLPEVKTPGEFQRVEHPPMGVKDQDAEAAMFLIVVGVIAAIVLAMAFAV